MLNTRFNLLVRYLFNGITMFRLSIFITLMLLGPIAHAEKIKVVGTHFNKIFEQDKTTGKFNGLAVDLLNKVAAKKNLQFEYAIYPWKRAQYLISTGRADILIGPYRTPEREKQMDFIPIPFYTDKMVFYTLKSKPFIWNGKIDLLKTKKILTIKGWVYGKYFEEVKDDLQIIEANDIETAFKMLVLQRGELLLANERNSETTLLKIENLNQFIKTKAPFSYTQGYFSFSLKYQNTEVKKDFHKALAQLFRDGIIKKINNNYKLSFEPRAEI